MSGVRSGRIVALYYLRGFVVVLVVLHHSVLAYRRINYFDPVHYLRSSAPIVDATQWVGFDILVGFNDGYFMSLMFLLSGLFVWPSLTRAGSGTWCRERLLRLGLPFAIAVVTVIPLAYYPSFRMAGGSSGFIGFWIQTIFSGPWPAGPAWFIGVLLAFDLVAASIFRLGGAGGWAAGVAPRPVACFGWLVLFSALAYLPMLAWFGYARWFSFGPFAVQASRVGHYVVYFLAGVAVGRLDLRRFLDSALPRQWAWWSLLAVLLFAGIVGETLAHRFGWLVLAPPVWFGLRGLGFVLFCAAASFACLAIFLRFARRPIAMWHSLAVNAYGIYILHYPAVIWLQ